jgi:hypothetical protein
MLSLIPASPLLRRVKHTDHLDRFTHHLIDDDIRGVSKPRLRGILLPCLAARYRQGVPTCRRQPRSAGAPSRGPRSQVVIAKRRSAQGRRLPSLARSMPRGVHTRNFASTAATRSGEAMGPGFFLRSRSSANCSSLKRLSCGPNSIEMSSSKRSTKLSRLAPSSDASWRNRASVCSFSLTVTVFIHPRSHVRSALTRASSDRHCALILLDFSHKVLYLYQMLRPLPNPRATSSASTRRHPRAQTLGRLTASAAQFSAADGSDGFVFRISRKRAVAGEHHATPAPRLSHASATAVSAQVCRNYACHGFDLRISRVRGRRRTLTKRLSNGNLTAKPAEIRRANASNGFDFALFAPSPPKPQSRQPLTAPMVRA